MLTKFQNKNESCIDIVGEHMKNYKELEDYRMFCSKAELQKALNTLHGIITGIALDQNINLEEISELTNWCNLQRDYIDYPPFNKIIPYVEEALANGTLTNEIYGDILGYCEQYDNNSDSQDTETHDIQELHGIIHGILSDNIVTEREAKSFYYWLKEHKNLTGTYPYDEIYSVICEVLNDWSVSEEETLRLKALLGNFVDTRYSMNVSQVEIEQLQEKYGVDGICARDPEISLEGKTFCFTGTSSRAKRNEIAEIITERGGLFNNNVTNKTDFLIVGNEGNPCWMFNCYGRKVEKAVSIRKTGGHIMLVNELDFWNYVDSDNSDAVNDNISITLCEQIKTIIQQSDPAYDTAIIKFSPYTSKDATSSTGSISMFDKPCFLVKGKKPVYLHIAPAFQKYFSSLELQRLESNPWKRIALTQVDITQFQNELVSIYEDCWLNSSEQFGCCSRYQECSNLMKCTQPDQELKGGCQYRQKLRNGIVFFK